MAKNKKKFGYVNHVVHGLNRKIIKNFNIFDNFSWYFDDVFLE